MVLGAVLRQLAHVNSLDEDRRRELLAQRSDPATWLGPRGVLRYLGPPGERSAAYFWPAETPRAVVLMVHGQGSYAEFEFMAFNGAGQPKTYAGSWVERLNAAGLSVAAIDNRGCGRSSGLFSYVTSHQEWVDDLLRFSKAVQHTDVPGFGQALPLFLCGSSLGGCISLLTALAKPDRFAGLVLLAPMVSLEGIKRKGLNPILTRVAALLTLVVPTWPLVKTGQTNTLFPELQADFDTDPVTYHYDTRVRVGVECLRACDRLVASLQRLDLPLLVFHSEQDTMTDPEGSKLLVARARGSDKTLRLLTGMWHVLTKEAGNEAILAEIIAWLHARLPALRPAAATAAGSLPN